MKLQSGSTTKHYIANGNGKDMGCTKDKEGAPNDIPDGMLFSRTGAYKLRPSRPCHPAQGDLSVYRITSSV